MRVLANHLFIHPEGDSVIVDRKIRLMLDAGVDPGDPSALAHSYMRSWWTNERCPEDDEFLKYDMLEAALKHHRTAQSSGTLLSNTRHIKKYTWSRHLSLDPQGQSLDCESCRQYRGVCIGVVDILNDIRHHVHAMEVGSRHREHNAGRRAAGFFNLYEGVLMKELNVGTSTKGKGKRKMSTFQQSEYVRNEAAAELSRLDDLPSQKWTWGTELSREEVINLKKPILPSISLQHSGYNISLSDDELGDQSSGPASPQIGQEVSDLASDIQSIPYLDANDYPTHFTLYPLRNYIGDPPKSFNEPRMNVSEAAAADAYGIKTFLSLILSYSIHKYLFLIRIRYSLPCSSRYIYGCVEFCCRGRRLLPDFIFRGRGQFC
jgi:hypothetical protein